MRRRKRPGCAHSLAYESMKASRHRACLEVCGVLGQEETGFTAADFATASPRPLAEAVRSHSALPCQHLSPWRSRC